MVKKKLHRVFAYGTLKNGFYFHDEYLGGDKSVFGGPARTTNEYTLYVDGMPHMVREAGEHGVKGELYEVDDDVLAKLDSLEGHPVVYKREIIEVLDETGNKTLAWSYLRPVHFKGRTRCWIEEEYL